MSMSEGHIWEFRSEGGYRMKEIALKHVALPNGERTRFRHRAGGDRVLVLVHGNLATSL
mgnify:FL=1|jgi:hypothetical protein